MGLITPPTYEARILAVGSNRSGKSAFMRELLSCYPRYVVIDLKGDFTPIGQHKVLRKPPALETFGWKSERIVYRPDPQYTTGYWLNGVFRHLYFRARRMGRRHPFIVYIDETRMLAAIGRQKEWLISLAVAGAALHVGLWYASQRVAWIPVELRSEAWNWYAFPVTEIQDQEEIVDHAGDEEFTRQELRAGWGNYAFWELKREHRGGGRMVREHHLAIDLTPVKKA